MNELDSVKAQLSQKDREKRDSQAIIDTLRDTLEERNATVESLQNALNKAEMLCSTLKKQMKFLEQRQDETKQAREEAHRLKCKMKTMEQIELLLQSQRSEVEMMNPRLHQPPFGDEIDLNTTFDVNTPPTQTSGSQHCLPKKLCLERARSPMQNVLKKVHKVSKPESQLSLGGQRCVGELDEELAGAFPLFIRNAVLGQKQPNRTTAESRCSTDVVRIGFDGLGGRTKFIQPRDTTIIRPVPVKSKAKSKQKVRIKTVSSASQPKLDTFLCQ